MNTLIHPSRRGFFAYFSADLTGGITAALASLPLALAFGVKSGLGAQAGLYGAIILGFVAALLGGTKGLISAPTAPMTAVTSIIIAQLVGVMGSVEQALPVIAMSLVVAGGFQILFGLIRVGQLVHYIPYAVVSGFMTGIGILILQSQVAPAVGLEKGEVLSLSTIHLSALSITAATLALLYGLKRWAKRLPGSLIALFVMTSLTLLFGVQTPVIGDIPSGLPSFILPELNSSVLWIVFFGGLQLGALGVLDTLLTSVIADNLTKTHHNSNRELYAQGLGNALAGLFGGLPGAGTTTCTVINIQGGAQTRVAGMANAVFLLLVLLFANTLAAQVPLAVLAGILIKVGLDIIDYLGFKYLKLMPKTDGFILFSVILLTVLVDLMVAVGAGVLFAVLAYISTMKGWKKTYQNKLHLADYCQEKHLPLPQTAERTLVMKIEGSLFFGFTPHWQSTLDNLHLEKEADTLVLCLDQVQYVDSSGIYALQESLRELSRNGIHLVLVGVSEGLGQILHSVGILGHCVSQQDLYKDLDSYLQSCGIYADSDYAEA